jgi:hypothetical protein
VSARDRFDRLICQQPDCGRPIGGVTGLDEIHNMRAHLAEHHDISLDMNEALELRAAWENNG